MCAPACSAVEGVQIGQSCQTVVPFGSVALAEYSLDTRQLGPGIVGAFGAHDRLGSVQAQRSSGFLSQLAEPRQAASSA